MLRPSSDPTQNAILGIELLAALLLPWLLLRERRATLTAVLLTGGGTIAAIGAIGAIGAIQMVLRATA